MAAFRVHGPPAVGGRPRRLRGHRSALCRRGDAEGLNRQRHDGGAVAAFVARGRLEGADVGLLGEVIAEIHVATAG